MLATHPDIQIELRKEMAGLSATHNGSLGAEVIRKSKLLEVGNGELTAHSRCSGRLRFRQSSADPFARAQCMFVAAGGGIRDIAIASANFVDQPGVSAASSTCCGSEQRAPLRHGRAV